MEQNNTEFRAFAEKNVCHVRLYTGKGGGIDPSSPDQFNVVKGSTYKYDVDGESLTFSDVSGNGRKVYYASPDDMYAFSTWNTVKDGKVFTPIPDGKTHEINVDMDFGPTFNPMLKFESSDDNLGSVEVEPSLKSIVVETGASITISNNVITFTNVDSKKITATAIANSGYQFSG